MLFSSKMHNVQCTPELQVRVPGQSQAGQRGKERTEGEGESSNPSSSSGQEISLSLQTSEANKVLSFYFNQRFITLLWFEDLIKSSSFLMFYHSSYCWLSVSLHISSGKKLMTISKHLKLGPQKEMHFQFSKLLGNYYSYIAKRIKWWVTS